MKRLGSGAIVVASLLAVLVDAPVMLLSHGSPAIAAAEVAVDVPLQESIDRAAQARNEGELAAALEELRGRAAPDYSDLVPQLAIFLLDARGEREGMAPAVIVSRLGISRAQIVAGVVPHLGTSNDRLRAQLENLLGAADHDAAGAVDFSEFRAYLAERPEAPSPVLVEYLFERSPADAAATFAAISGKPGKRASDAASIALVEGARGALAKTGRVGDESRDQVRSAFEALSRHPDWWMRCYAAAVLGADGRLAELAGNDSVERLSKDSDERVRRAVRAAAPVPAP